jgi:hypothetical protein
MISVLGSLSKLATIIMKAAQVVLMLAMLIKEILLGRNYHQALRALGFA